MRTACGPGHNCLTLFLFFPKLTPISIEGHIQLRALWKAISCLLWTHCKNWDILYPKPLAFRNSIKLLSADCRLRQPSSISRSQKMVWKPSCWQRLSILKDQTWRNLRLELWNYPSALIQYLLCTNDSARHRSIRWDACLPGSRSLLKKNENICEQLSSNSRYFWLRK